MKKITLVLSLAIIALFVTSISAYAETISFTDTHKYWDGWGNGTSDDNSDTIGIPNFKDGQATIASNRLNNLTFNRYSGTSSYWGILSPGDLFINIGNDSNWDYVVDLTSWTVPGPLNLDVDAVEGYYNIYSLSLGLNSTTGYIKSGSDNSGEWAGWLIRNDHPVAADFAALQAAQIGSAHFSGWNNGNTTQYSFDFDGLNLGHSGNFTIGWQPNCANDVVYENLHYTATPEPATLALLGMGVVGLLRLRRKKA